MNKIAEAADKLRDGWCKNATVDGDKFCAVGALGASLLGYVVNSIEGFREWDEECYRLANTSDEGRILAQTIMEQHPEMLGFDHLFKQEQYDEIIYVFNDDQDSVEPVIQMFEKAAVVWDEKYA